MKFMVGSTLFNQSVMVEILKILEFSFPTF